MVRRLKVAILVGALVLLSGCTECKAPFLPQEVPDDAPDTGGRAARTMYVRALLEDGPAREFSAYVFWKKPGDASTIQAMGLRTTDGLITAHVPTDEDVGIVVGDVPSYAERWTLLDGRILREDVYLVRLYKTQLNGTVAFDWTGVEASGWEVGPFYFELVWDPHILALHPDPERQREYLARATRFTATLTWTNGPTESASLGLMLARNLDESAHCRYQDQDNELAPGPHSEAFDSSLRSQGFLCGNGFNFTGADKLYVGAATDQQMVAPFGLNYRIAWRAEFEHRPELQNLCSTYADSDTKVEKLDPRSGVPQNRTTFRGGGSSAQSPGFDAASLGLVAGVMATWAAARSRRR
ncbi:MAG: hypothetical protein HYT80_05925 [Euryarchaeota archaeon]|nr:hypothetical protein [Euryarchaeota archaeon]